MEDEDPLEILIHTLGLPIELFGLEPFE